MIIIAECLQIYTGLSQLNPAQILITSCCLTRLVLNCHLCLGFPRKLFPWTILTRSSLYLNIIIFYTHFLCTKEYSSFGPQLYSPINISCRKVSAELRRNPPTRLGETPLYALRTKKWRNDYITSLLQ